MMPDSHIDGEPDRFQDPVTAARAEAVVQAKSIAMDDAREGIAALLEKRAPRFTGR